MSGKRTNAERQRRYRERMRAQGFSLVTVDVPTERLDDLLALAAQYREEYRAKRAAE